MPSSTPARMKASRRLLTLARIDIASGDSWGMITGSSISIGSQNSRMILRQPREALRLPIDHIARAGAVSLSGSSRRSAATLMFVEDHAGPVPCVGCSECWGIIGVGPLPAGNSAAADAEIAGRNDDSLADAGIG